MELQQMDISENFQPLPFHMFAPDLPINDDCVLHILERLSTLTDLANVAEIDELNMTAKRVFSYKWNGDITLSHSTRERAYAIFRHFGPQIKSIRLKPSDPSRMHEPHILYFIIAYCNQTLTSLSIQSMRFPIAEEITSSVFGRLSKLTLEDSLISMAALEHCTQLKELNLIRIEDSQGMPKMSITLNTLKSFKFVVHPNIPCPQTLCEMNATHLESLGDKTLLYALRIGSIHDIATPHNIEFLAATPTLECLEVDALPIHSIVSVCSSIESLTNLRSLRLYCEYTLTYRFSPDFFVNLEHLPELTHFVWGYPRYFSPRNLISIVRKAKNLQQLVVCISRKPIDEDTMHRPSLAIDRLAYGEVLADLMAKRSNGKGLEVIIVAKEMRQVEKFKFPIPAEAPLTIKCLQYEDIATVVNVDLSCRNARIKMTDEQIEMVRAAGVI